MLPRSLAHSLSKAPSTATTCSTCICSCGRRFLPEVRQHVQRRQKGARASPAVWREQHAEKRRRPIGAKERQEKEDREKEDHDWHMTNINRAVELNIISTDAATLTDFLNAFAELCKNPRSRRSGASPVDLEELQELIGRLDITEHDCNWVAHGLLISPRPEDNVYGKKLMYALSHLGSEIATMRIMKQALQEAKQKPAKLNATEIQHMRKHLKQVAEKGENYRGMVLEGKVEFALGNQSAAIKLWTDAMEAAVAFAEDRAAQRAKGERTSPDKDAMPGSDHEDLDAPWVELSQIHIHRQEWAKAKWAVTVGCEQDDPTSHYYAAAFFEKRTDENGELLATSTWLYHMTKAAASGHPKAAHELGNFYAHSLWPYIEDEPPDHVKPTPFDKYPPLNPELTKSRWSLSSTVRELLGLQTPTHEEPSENIFKTATFPSTPEGRMRIAFEWLKIGIAHTYAPSNLLAAKLHLEKTLWSDAATPTAALDLKDERYTYASKADHDAGRPIDRTSNCDSSGAEMAEGQERDGGEGQEQGDLPNPFYNPSAAYDHIRRIFHAHGALRARSDFLAGIARLRKSGGRKIDQDDVEEYFLTEEGMETGSMGADGRRQGRGAVGPEVRVWYRFPEVREMYSDDREGVIFDDTGTERVDLWEAAKAVCEKQQWDVYDEQGGLLYRHGMGKRKAGSAPGGR